MLGCGLRSKLTSCDFDLFALKSKPWPTNNCFDIYLANHNLPSCDVVFVVLKGNPWLTDNCF